MKYFILLLLLGLGLTSSYADSPLTSTFFSSAYSDEPFIKSVPENSVLSSKAMEFLADKKNTIDVKVALINKLGWDINGKTNSQIYLNQLLKTKNYASKEQFLEKGTADELLCYAYLKALDDYFVVDEALQFANAALQKNSKSYTFNIIHALIQAQKLFDSDWCQVYQSTNQVRLNTQLELDLNKEAISIIFEYMDAYKEYCDKK